MAIGLVMLVFCQFMESVVVMVMSTLGSAQCVRMKKGAALHPLLPEGLRWQFKALP